VHAKGTRRKRETLRGYAPPTGLTKSGVPGHVVRRSGFRLAILAPTKSCGKPPRLLACPFCCGRGGTWLARCCWPNANTLNLRGVRW
jgi:hypothetical protein